MTLVSTVNSSLDLSSLYTKGRDKLNMASFLLIFRILTTEVYCKSKHSRSRFHLKVKETSLIWFSKYPYRLKLAHFVT